MTRELPPHRFPFKLMRRIHEPADPISQAISNIVDAVDIARHRFEMDKLPKNITTTESLSMASFFMKFWNMKNRGELHIDEPPATYAVLMRAVPVRNVVDIVLDNATQPPAAGLTSFPWRQPRQVMRLIHFLQEAKRHQFNTPNRVSKLCGQLVAHLRRANENINDPQHVRTFDASDCELLLRACETTLRVEDEDEKQWTR